MGAYNVKEIKFLNQTQIKVYNKPIEFDNKKVRANERKKENKERTQPVSYTHLTLPTT